MSFIDVKVKLGSHYVTSYVISYERTKSICTGIGSFNFVISKTVPHTLDLWDKVYLYEGSHKVGTYYIGETGESVNPGNLSVSCLDGSKKLTDYFISEQYTTTGITYSLYWLVKFLDEAGIDYDISAIEDDGLPIVKDTVLGMMSAYDQVFNLCQQNGWVFYFDKDNTCIIGSVIKDSESPDHSYKSHDIINMNIDKNDKMYRNRAVVWGKQDPITSQWVFADITKHTSWDYDNKDIRTMVLANSTIQSGWDAENLANEMLNEFCKHTYQKEIELDGDHNIELTDTVTVKTKYFTGSGLVTTVGSSLSSNGLITRFILDERCPRMFGYFGWTGSYVYIGTSGFGVWRKPIGGATWTDFSTGITDLNIIDLSVNNGICACVTSSGAVYLRYIYEGVWFVYTPPIFTETLDPLTLGHEYLSSDVKAVACSIDRWTNEIYIAYNTIDSEIRRSWSVTKQIFGTETISQIAIIVGEESPLYNVKTLDIGAESGSTKVLVSYIHKDIVDPSEYYLKGTNSICTGNVKTETWDTGNPLTLSMAETADCSSAESGCICGYCFHNYGTQSIYSLGGFAPNPPYNWIPGPGGPTFLLVIPELSGYPIPNQYWYIDSFYVEYSYSGTLKCTPDKTYGPWPGSWVDVITHEYKNGSTVTETISGIPSTEEEYYVSGGGSFDTGSYMRSQYGGEGVLFSLSFLTYAIGAKDYMGDYYLYPNMEFTGKVKCTISYSNNIIGEDKNVYVINLNNNSVFFNVCSGSSTGIPYAKLDTTQNNLISVYGGNPTSIPHYGFVDTTNDPTALFYDGKDNYINFVTPNSFVSDAKTYTGYVVGSGYKTFLGITQPNDSTTPGSDGYIKYIPSDSIMTATSIADFQLLASFVGNVNHFETSNFGHITHPHFFVSISGVPSKFYEQLRDSLLWTEYSITLPSGEITIIDVDDMI
jgi:hypothetical protein